MVLFSTFFDYQKFDLFFSTFLIFSRILSRTWGINFDTIACLFELVYGPQKILFSTNFRLFEKNQNDMGIKKFLANRPFLIRKNTPGG